MKSKRFDVVAKKAEEAKQKKILKIIDKIGIEGLRKMRRDSWQD